MGTYALYSAGSNSHGQLGHPHRDDLSHFAAVPLRPTERVLELVCGSTHTLVLVAGPGASRSRLFGSGSNAQGQLGPGGPECRLGFAHIELEALRLDQLDLADFELSAIATTWETSLVVLRRAGSSDVVLSMGANDWGELGCTSPVAGRVQRVELAHLSGPRETLHVLSITAGPRHIVALVEVRGENRSGIRKLVGWGAARHGQHGIPLLPPSSSSPRIYALPTPLSLPPSIELDDLARVALGRDHTALLFRSATRTHVLLLGSAKQGQLGPDVDQSLGTVESGLHESVSQLECCWTGTYILGTSTACSDSTLVACGSNAHHQLAQATSLGSSSALVSIPARQARQIDCGSEHVLALRGDGAVLGWGWNEHGNLGTGSLVDVPSPEVVWPADDPRGAVVKVWGGNATSWLLVQRR